MGLMPAVPVADIADERAVTNGEVLALQLARDAGIRAVDAGLVNSDGAQVALIRRFDRQDGVRIRYASAATMMGERRDGQDHAYSEIFDAIRVHCARAGGH